MALERPKNVQVNMSALANQLRSQTVTHGRARTKDPNVPTYSYPLGKKALLYFPKLIRTVEGEGYPEFDIDKPLVHSINYRATFEKVRCTSGIVDPNQGFDGSCPLCEVEALVRQLRFVHRDIYVFGKEHRDISELSAERTREYNKEFFRLSGLPDYVSSPSRRYTIPVVEIPTHEEIRDSSWNSKVSVLTPDFNANGGLDYKKAFFSVSEYTFENQIQQSIGCSEEKAENPDAYGFVEPTGVAGALAVFTFGKIGEDGRQPSAMQAIKDLTCLRVNDNERLQGINLEAIDRDMDDWRAPLALSTLMENELIPVEYLSKFIREVRVVVEQELASKQQELETLRNGGEVLSSVGVASTSALNRLASGPSGTVNQPSSKPAGLVLGGGDTDMGLVQAPQAPQAPQQASLHSFRSGGGVQF